MGVTTSTAEKPARRRKQQRTVDTRLKIVKAALSEFSLRGFEGGSTRRIAEAAQVPHSLVIYHFKTKEQLWYDTIREAVQWYTRRPFGVLEPLREGDPAAQLKRMFAYYIRFSAENPDFSRLFTRENALNSERLAWLVENHVGPMQLRTTQLIAKAQAQGTFAPGDPITLLYMFHGAATSPYRSAQEIRLITGKSPSDPAAVEAHIALCETLFFRSVVKS